MWTVLQIFSGYNTNFRLGYSMLHPIALLFICQIYNLSLAQCCLQAVCMFHSKTTASRGDVQLPTVTTGQPRAQLPGETVRQQGEGRSGTPWGRRQSRHHSLRQSILNTSSISFLAQVCVWCEFRTFLCLTVFMIFTVHEKYTECLQTILRRLNLLKKGFDNTLIQ